MATDTTPRRRDTWFTEVEQEVLAGFLAGYSGLTALAHRMAARVAIVTGDGKSMRKCRWSSRS